MIFFENFLNTDCIFELLVTQKSNLIQFSVKPLVLNECRLCLKLGNENQCFLTLILFGGGLCN